MKVYLSGPMRGYKDFNFPAFDTKAQELRLRGHEVFNPADRDRGLYGDVFKGTVGKEKEVPKFSLREALAADCEWICKMAEAIYFLPGWEKSTGALAERAVAKALGIPELYDGESVAILKGQNETLCKL